MKKEKNVVEKVISNMAYMSAKKNVNSTCTYFFHQPKVPDRVKKLRKY